MTGDEDRGELTPEQQAEQDEQLIRDVDRRHPEWADTVRRDLELRRQLAGVEADLPDDVRRELARDLADVDRERLLTPAELLAEANRIMDEANQRASRLMRRFDELPASSRTTQATKRPPHARHRPTLSPGRPAPARAPRTPADRRKPAPSTGGHLSTRPRSAALYPRSPSLRANWFGVVPPTA